LSEVEDLFSAGRGEGIFVGWGFEKPAVKIFVRVKRFKLDGDFGTV
jgi:hypothetical protein